MSALTVDRWMDADVTAAAEAADDRNGTAEADNAVEDDDVAAIGKVHKEAEDFTGRGRIRLVVPKEAWDVVGFGETKAKEADVGVAIDAAAAATFTDAATARITSSRIRNVPTILGCLSLLQSAPNPYPKHTIGLYFCSPPPPLLEFDRPILGLERRSKSNRNAKNLITSFGQTSGLRGNKLT